MSKKSGPEIDECTRKAWDVFSGATCTVCSVSVIAMVILVILSESNLT